MSRSTARTSPTTTATDPASRRPPTSPPVSDDRRPPTDGTASVAAATSAGPRTPVSGGLPRTVPPAQPEEPRRTPCPAADIRSTIFTITPPRRRTLPMRTRPLRLALPLPHHRPFRRPPRIRRPHPRRAGPTHPPRTPRRELAGPRRRPRRRHLGPYRPDRNPCHRRQCARPRLHRHFPRVPRRDRTTAAPHPRFPRDPRPPGRLHGPGPRPPYRRPVLGPGEQ